MTNEVARGKLCVPAHRQTRLASARVGRSAAPNPPSTIRSGRGRGRWRVGRSSRADPKVSPRCARRRVGRPYPGRDRPRMEGLGTRVGRSIPGPGDADTVRATTTYEIEKSTSSPPCHEVRLKCIGSTAYNCTNSH
eukprot:4139641-Prymnesium_polylepis.3